MKHILRNDDWTLARLIGQRKGDRSFKRLSLDCGGIPTANRLQQMATKDINAFPDPDTIRGMSLGLGTTITEVTLAIARSLGLNVASGEPDALTLAGAGALPVEAQEAIISVSREMQRLYSPPKRLKLVSDENEHQADGEFAEQAAFNADARGEVFDTH